MREETEDIKQAEGCKSSWELMWNTQLGIRYHSHLQSFYSRIGKFITVLSLVTSSAAFATIYQSDVGATKILACIVALAQIFDLVIDTKGKGLLHASLKQRYLHLESELSGKSLLPVGEEQRLQQKRILIELDEPPVISALMGKCHNELVKVRNIGDEHKEKLSWFDKAISIWL